MFDALTCSDTVNIDLNAKASREMLLLLDSELFRCLNRPSIIFSVSLSPPIII